MDRGSGSGRMLSLLIYPESKASQSPDIKHGSRAQRRITSMSRLEVICHPQHTVATVRRRGKSHANEGLMVKPLVRFPPLLWVDSKDVLIKEFELRMPKSNQRFIVYGGIVLTTEKSFT